jgi:hypothetical protein
MCSFNLADDSNLEQIGLFATFENYDFQEVFIQTLTQFSKRNKVLDAPPSNTDGILSREKN